VTIEVKPNQNLDYNDWFSRQPDELKNEIESRRLADKKYTVYETPEYWADRENQPPIIKQVKGKGNAKPKDTYLPFVQDFIKGGQWSRVEDFKNTGLIKEGGQMMTPAEHADWLANQLTPPPDGMKRGGKVQFANNIDAMRLALSKG
jgi:hypothetical protein